MSTRVKRKGKVCYTRKFTHINIGIRYPRRKYLSQLSCAVLPCGFDSRDPAMVRCGIIGFIEEKERAMQTLASLRNSRAQEYLGAAC